jgi:SAM-dependent methyltransferase
LAESRVPASILLPLFNLQRCRGKIAASQVVPTRASTSPMKILQRNRTTATPQTWQEMTNWYQSALGTHLLQHERALLEQLLARRFGYHLLQLGCAELILHDQSPMGHKFSFCAWAEQNTCHTAIARGEAIPLASSSVDLVLLHHALDFSDQQHQLLREVERVLIAGGHLVIIGFNPLSSWGLRSALQRLTGRGRAPWQAAMLGTTRLSDWLKLLGFQIEQQRHAVYALPVNAPRVIRYSGLLETSAAQLNWPTGGIYAIAARKQVLPLTPVQSHWRRLPVHGLGLPLPEKVSQASRDCHKASNEEQGS